MKLLLLIIILAGVLAIIALSEQPAYEIHEYVPLHDGTETYLTE